MSTMRRLYPIGGGEPDLGGALRALSLLTGYGVHLLDPRRWLIAEVPAEVTRRPGWLQLETLLRERSGGLALLARTIGMMAEANPPEELPRRLRRLSGEGLQVAEGVLGRHVDLLDRQPTSLSAAELDLLYAALAAALAYQAGEP
jgi:hypothetical protein